MTIDEFEEYLREKLNIAERNRDFSKEDDIQERAAWQDGYATAIMDVLENFERIQPR